MQIGQQLAHEAMILITKELTVISNHPVELRPENIKFICMLNSFEHEIGNLNKYKNNFVALFLGGWGGGG